MKTHLKQTLASIALLSAMVLFTSSVSIAQSKDGTVIIHIEKDVNRKPKAFDTPYTQQENDNNTLPRNRASEVDNEAFNTPAKLEDEMKNLKIEMKDFSVEMNDDSIKKYMHIIINDDFIAFNNDITVGDLDEEMPIIENKTEKDGDKVIIYNHVIMKDKNQAIVPGVKEPGKTLNLNNLKIYPNPSDGKFNISFLLDAKGDLKVSLSDVNGKEIIAREFSDFSGIYNNSFDLSDQAKGVYILSISQGDKQLTKEIVIN